MKRYPEYKDSGMEWIGKIPASWKLKKIKYLIRDKITDGPHETPKFIFEGVPFLSVDSIQEGELIFNNCRFISHEDHEKFRKKCVVEKSDILMGKAASIGKIAQVKVDFSFSIWSPLALIKTNKEIAHPTFIEYSLKSDLSQYQVEILCTSNTQKNISMDDIPKILLVAPSLPEQYAIASFLNHKTRQIDDLIAKKQRLIELLQEERTALINTAVTKGLSAFDKSSADSVPLKDSGIEWLGEIPEHWEVIAIKKICKVNPTKSEIILPESAEVVFLPMEKVYEDGDYDDSELKPISSLKGYTYFAKGDVIIAKITPCFENGKGAFLENLKTSIGFGSTEFHVLRPIAGISDGIYLYYFTHSHCFTQVAEAFMVGSAGQKRVQTSFLENFFIPMPSYQEQLSIAEKLRSFLMQINDSIQHIKKEIELMYEYKTSLINEAVTGKIDVRDYQINHA